MSYFVNRDDFLNVLSYLKDEAIAMEIKVKEGELDLHHSKQNISYWCNKLVGMELGEKVVTTHRSKERK